MKNPIKTAGSPLDPIESAQRAIYDESHVTVPRKTVELAIAAYESALHRLPAVKCGNCGNGVDVIWNNCPWCGHEASWLGLRPGPHTQSKSK